MLDAGLSFEEQLADERCLTESQRILIQALRDDRDEARRETKQAATRIQDLEKQISISAPKLDRLLVLEDAALKWDAADKAAVADWGDEDETLEDAASDAKDELIEAAHEYAAAHAALLTDQATGAR